MSKRTYTLEQLQEKQLRTAARQAMLLEKAKRATEHKRALEKKIAEQMNAEREAHLRMLGELLEKYLPEIRSMDSGSAEALLQKHFSSHDTEVTAHD